MAANCSPIGIGNDVGGSVRIPAEFCGTYSLKTSINRLSYCHTYWTRSLYGQKNIVLVVGPMGKSTNDLALWMKTATCE
jgi:amidase